MPGARKRSTPDLGSESDAQIEPGLLGAVSTSNIIAGGRTRNNARLATMLVGRGEDSRKKDTMMTAAPTATPTVAAAAGTAIYQDSYGGTVAPAEALKKVGEYCVKATTAALTPTVAAAAGTESYEDSYGDTVSPAEALKKRGKTARANKGEDSRKKDTLMMAAPTPSVAAAAGTAIEVDYMSEQADGAVAISEYSADNETGGSGPSGRTRKPPAKKL